ncbi:MAG: hypothetical protein B7Z06_10995, partial [Flavobacteriales bacterium 32-35-8]
WIGENNNVTEFAESKFAFKNMTRTMRNSVDGEEEIIIPSKKIRQILKITELDNKTYFDIDNNQIGFKHQINTERYSYGDSQEIILLKKDILFKELKNKKMKLFWLATHFIKKNPLNDNIREVIHNQKTRKYILWFDDQNELQNLKYFEEKFSNE